MVAARIITETGAKPLVDVPGEHGRAAATPSICLYYSGTAGKCQEHIEKRGIFPDFSGLLTENIIDKSEFR